MYPDILRAVKTRPRRHSSGERKRNAHKHRPSSPERLEDRRLLSGGPTVFTVTDTSDLATDPGSLAFAINQANINPNPAGSLIQFSKPLFTTPQTITLTSELDIFGSGGPITIAGPGANLLTVSGNRTVRVFDIDFSSNVVLSGLTISGGTASRDGAGVFNGGILTLVNSDIQNNAITSDDAEGAGIWSEGVLAMSGCTVAGNTINGADGEGAGVFNEDQMSISHSTITNNTISGSAGEGGGVWSDDMGTITGSTITNNTLSEDDGEGGGTWNDGVMTLLNCTVLGNSASGTSTEGGGCWNEDVLNVVASTIAMNSSGSEGGGIWNDEVLTIPNSTVASNSAGSEGGGIWTENIVTAVNTTIADNTVLRAIAIRLAVADGVGGGLFLDPGTQANLTNSIVARNTFGTAPDDVEGILAATSTFNLIGTGGAGGLTNGVNGNLVGVANPGLGTLANNGGPTNTIALLPGSPAVDAGSNALDGLANDQRGPGLVRTFGASIDIGAFELQPATVTSVSVDWGTAGSAALQTAADGLRLLPAGRNIDLPWSGINKLQVTFNEPENLSAADVTITSARGVNYGPVTISGSGESFTITLAQPILKADRVTIVMASAGIAQFVRRLDVLPGDVNDNGAVNKADVQVVRSASTGATPAAVFADIVGSGTVGATDVKAVKKLMGKSLPKLRHVQKVALGQALVREHVPFRRHHH
jgi:hypothetical protein